jgi:hypothetical protein
VRGESVGESLGDGSGEIDVDLTQLYKEMFNGEWDEKLTEPPSATVRRAQAAIAQAAGTWLGRPLVVCKWAPRVRRFVFGRQRLRLKAAAGFYYDEPAFNPATKLIEPKKVSFEVGIPRYVLMQHIPDANCKPSWERNRFHDGEDALGPFPAGGYYREIPTDCFIVDHRDECCLRAADEEHDCYGYFREPGDDTIERVTLIAYQMEIDLRSRAIDEAASAEERAQMTKELVDVLDDAERRAEEQISDQIESVVKPFDAIIEGNAFGDYGASRRKGFSLFGE